MNMLNEDGHVRSVMFDASCNQYYVVVNATRYYGYIKDDIFYSRSFHKIVPSNRENGYNIR